MFSWSNLGTLTRSNGFGQFIDVNAPGCRPASTARCTPDPFVIAQRNDVYAPVETGVASVSLTLHCSPARMTQHRAKQMRPPALPVRQHPGSLPKINLQRVAPAHLPSGETAAHFGAPVGARNVDRIEYPPVNRERRADSG